MKKHLKKILSFGIVLSILFVTLANPIAAENVNIDVIETPKIDITLTSKDTDLDLTNFEIDLTNKLKEKGINTSNINFVTVNREYTETNADALNFENAVNNWTVVGAPGWYATSDNGIMMSVLGAHTSNTRGSILNTCYQYGSNNYKNYNWANSQGAGIVTTDENGKQLTGRALMKKISSQVKSSGYLGTGYTVGWTSALIQELPVDTTELHVSFDVSNNSNLHNGFCFNVTRRDNPTVSNDGGNEDNLTGYFFNLTRHYDTNGTVLFYTGNSPMWIDPEIDAVSVAQTINTYNMNTWSKNGYGASNSMDRTTAGTWTNFLYYVNDGDFDAPFGASGVSGGCDGTIYRGTKVAEWTSSRTTQQYYTETSVNHYDVDVSNGHVKITLGGKRDTVENGFGVIGGKVVAEFDIPEGNNLGGSFGFYGINCERACSMKVTNFVALTERNYVKTYKDVLTEPTWREDAKHVIVNVDNNVDDTLTSTSTIGEILSRTLADDIHFIQWGTDTNKSATTNFIKQNDNKGTFTYNSDYDQALNDTANYIKSLIKQQESEEQIITIGQEVNLLVTPEKFKNNAISSDYPNGRWKINHEYKYFANNLGQSAESGVYSPNLNCNFDKPGKYEITFDDEVVKTIYVHRKPVADFEINIENLMLELKSTSLDLDSNTNNGIASEKWYYKEASASEWTEGKLTQLDKTKIYVIKLEVEDFQGATNYTTKYVGTGNPVSKFNFANDTVCKYNKLEINNSSYDPIGYDISTQTWELKKDGTLIGVYSKPILDFNTSNLGPGNYSYTLTITNSVNTKSESYTKSFTIVDDIVKPEIIIDTETTNDWLLEKEVNIEVSDNESNVSKWRYEFVTSPTPTIEDTDWSNWDTEKRKVNVNSGALSGRYYLHIQAYDEANNLTERTIGPFNLDNTNPVINGVDVEKQGFRDNKVTIHAFDEHSGIVGYALTKYEPTTFDMRSRTFTTVETPEFQESNEFKVDRDGLYTAWAIDELGNIETSVCEVTNSNQTDKTTTVYAEIGSEFKVTIPKKIVLDGATKSGTYQITVEGDIAGLEIVNVTPDSAVTLSSKDKADVIGTITQDKTNWTYSEMYADSKILANGSILAQDITAGAWNGTFNFAIKLENNGKYTNSEWYVEYQDVTFDMEELDNSTTTEPTE